MGIIVHTRAVKRFLLMDFPVLILSDAYKPIFTLTAVKLVTLTLKLESPSLEF